MKKMISLVLCVLLCISFAGCSGSGDGGDTVAVVNTKNEQNEIDVDLTALTSTMVYSEVYNMLITPDDYIGKTVKMKGQFAVYPNDNTGEEYFAVIIADATACCQQGLEFVLNDEYSYPDDYPEVGTEVEVTGEFQTYKEGDLIYCYLVSGDMTVC